MAMIPTYVVADVETPICIHSGWKYVDAAMRTKKAWSLKIGGNT